MKRRSKSNLTTTQRNKKKKMTMEENEMIVEEGPDLISELPDSLLHHILSFIDMIFVVRTCILSKRWKHLWVSTPILNFNDELFNLCVKPSTVSEYSEKPTSLNSKFAQFVTMVLCFRRDCNVKPSTVSEYSEKPTSLNSKFAQFVTRVLCFRHDCQVLTHSFYFSCKTWNLEISLKFNEWVGLLVDSRVEVFDIKIESFDDLEFELPKCLYKCDSLTTLKLDMGEKKAVFSLPDSFLDISLPSLKTLHFRSLSFTSGIVHVISSCEVLETLVVSDCVHGPDKNFKFRISSPKLKNLVVERMSDDEHYLDECQLEIWAPELTSFSCRDYTLNRYSFKKIDSLVEADIDTDFAADYYSKALTTDYNIVMMKALQKIVYSQNVMECLKGIRNVTSLKLSAWLLEVTQWSMARDKCTQFHKLHQLLENYAAQVSSIKSLSIDPFCNLKFLTLKTSLSIYQLRGITILLKKCPVLETLALNMTKPPDHQYFNEIISYLGEEEECWEAVMAPECKMNHLKFVEISDTLASANELELLKFLMTNATILEKVIVNPSKNSPKNEKELKKFVEKLTTFPAASSRLEIFSL